MLTLQVPLRSDFRHCENCKILPPPPLSALPSSFHTLVRAPAKTSCSSIPPFPELEPSITLKRVFCNQKHPSGEEDRITIKITKCPLHCWPLFLILLHLFEKKIKKMLPRYPWRAPGYNFKEMTPTQILCKSRFLSRSDLCHLTRRGECHGCPDSN